MQEAAEIKKKKNTAQEGVSKRCPAGVAAHHGTSGLRPRPALLFCWLCSVVSEHKSFQTQSNPPQNNGNKAVSPTVLVM